MSAAASGPWSRAISSGALLCLGPAAAALVAGSTGKVATIFFCGAALIAWGAAGVLLTDLTRERPRWPEAARWSQWIVACSGLMIAALSFQFPALPKLAFATMLLTFLIGSVCWASLRWTSFAIRPLRLIKEAIALLIVWLWLLFADSDWYLIITMPFGTRHTTPYLTVLPLWWWFVCFAVPAVLFALQTRSIGLSRDIVAARLTSATRAMPTRRFVETTGILIVVLAALLLALDSALPRIGHQIYEGDEYGYVFSAYSLFQPGPFNPPHMPLITLWIASIFAVAGDSPTALLLGNIALVLAGVLFWLGTLRLLTSDLRVILLGGLLVATLRTSYLFVATPLSETLNNTLWSAAIFFLIAAVRRPVWPVQAAFGVTIALLLLCRSQNLGGVAGLLLVGTALTLLRRANRNAMTPMITAALIGCFVVSAVVPLAAWGGFRKATIGKFQIFDGRGAEVMLGMNSPGVSNGLNAGAWTPNVERWQKENPGASTTDMLLAAARFRLANPQETGEYLWYRALEFFNVRIAIQLKSGFAGIVTPNIQLLIGLLACILLLDNANRWVGVMIWTIFLPFMTTFLLIYSEARYRAPMDQILTFGVTALAANLLFGGAIPIPARMAPIVTAQTLRRQRIIAAAAAVMAIILLAGVFLAVDIKRGGKLLQLAAAELKPAGSTVVDRMPVLADDLRQLPSFKDLLSADDMASLQGKMFCDQFEMNGSLFKESLAYYRDSGVRGAERFSHGYPKEDYNNATLTGSIEGARLKVRRLALSFDGAVIARGVKQRGKVSVTGRVSRLPAYYSAFAAKDAYWFLDALYVTSADGPGGQACPR